MMTMVARNSDFGVFSNANATTVGTSKIHFGANIIKALDQGRRSQVVQPNSIEQTSIIGTQRRSEQPHI